MVTQQKQMLLVLWTLPNKQVFSLLNVLQFFSRLNYTQLLLLSVTDVETPGWLVLAPSKQVSMAVC